VVLGDGHPVEAKLISELELLELSSERSATSDE
jgi:hypothetical protein